MLSAKTSTQSNEESTDSQPLRIAIQGYEGAFHEIAARFYYGQEPLKIVPAHTFEDVVQMVGEGKVADVGLMAIENSLAGSLMFNYNLLNNSQLKIVGEVYLRIKQNLMALPGQTIADIKEVHSHYMAIAQSREYFRQFPHIRLVETEDTALSARNIRENNWTGIGAIASTLAADMYNLDILAASIETNKQNYTRFLVLENDERASRREVVDKVSICFAVDHEVGSLYKVLAVLAAYNINLTKIQSTPIVGKPWEYRFFLDFVTEGKVTFEQAITAIHPLTSDLKVMGAYPRGEHYEY